MPSSFPKSVFNARPFHSSSLSSRRSTFLFLFLFGLSGFIFGLTAFFRPNPCPSSRPKSVWVTWNHEGDTARAASPGVENRHKVMGFVGIFTGFGSVGRRQALRKTWFPSDPSGLQSLEEATGLAFRFIIGRISDRSKMTALQKEIAEYDDFIQLDIEEEYSWLTLKLHTHFLIVTSMSKRMMTYI